MNGVDLIAAERARQLAPKSAGGEGWDARHDRGEGERLAQAAATYALPHNQRIRDWAGWLRIDLVSFIWPWDRKWWKPAKTAPGSSPSIDERVRELTKAGALIAAAIDSLLDPRR